MNCVFPLRASGRPFARPVTVSACLRVMSVKKLPFGSFHISSTTLRPLNFVAAATAQRANAARPASVNGGFPPSWSGLA
jgi:hypothetical protein